MASSSRDDVGRRESLVVVPPNRSPSSPLEGLGRRNNNKLRLTMHRRPLRKREGGKSEKVCCVEGEGRHFIGPFPSPLFP